MVRSKLWVGAVLAALVVTAGGCEREPRPADSEGEAASGAPEGGSGATGAAETAESATTPLAWLDESDFDPRVAALPVHDEERLQARYATWLARDGLRDITLPCSTSGLSLRDDRIAVAASTTASWVNHALAQPLAGMGAPVLPAGAPLGHELALAVVRARDISERGGGAPVDSMVLAVDHTLPFGAVAGAIVDGVARELSHMGLLTRACRFPELWVDGPSNTDLALLPFESPHDAPADALVGETATGAPPRLLLTVTHTGFALGDLAGSAAFAESGLANVIVPREAIARSAPLIERLDFRRLYEVLHEARFGAAWRDRWEEAPRLLVTATATVPVGVVVRAMDVARFGLGAEAFADDAAFRAAEVDPSTPMFERVVLMLPSGALVR